MTVGDLYLDPDTFDLPTRSRVVEGDDRIRQQVEGALRLEVGEHPGDPSKGLPWSTWLSMRRAPKGEIRARCMLVVQRIPSVERCSSVVVSSEPDRLAITFEAVLVSGRRLSGGVGWQRLDPSSPRILPGAYL